jgi:hypothetical protein
MIAQQSTILLLCSIIQDTHPSIHPSTATSTNHCYLNFLNNECKTTTKQEGRFFLIMDDPVNPTNIPSAIPIAIASNSSSTCKEKACFTSPFVQSI